MQKSGCTSKVLLCGHSGAKSLNEGWKAFQNMLQYGRPKHLIWSLGMNDLDDETGFADNPESGTISEKWAAGINIVSGLCKQFGVTLVLTTIPSAYLRNHEYKNKWIRESGYLYIDFAKAVNAHIDDDGFGVWDEGLRENETKGLHPSRLGARLLWCQVMIDFPQICK